MTELATVDGIAVQLGVSAGMIAATTIVHAVFIALAAVLVRTSGGRIWGALRALRDTVMLVIVTIILFAAHAIEMAMWAGAFLHFDLFADVETALYFAAVTYTTLGFGDLLIDPPWRLLSGAAAANGLLLFGLSAAFLVEISVKLRLSRA